MEQRTGRSRVDDQPGSAAGSGQPGAPGAASAGGSSRSLGQVALRNVHRIVLSGLAASSAAPGLGPDAAMGHGDKGPATDWRETMPRPLGFHLGAGMLVPGHRRSLPWSSTRQVVACARMAVMSARAVAVICRRRG